MNRYKVAWLLMPLLLGCESNQKVRTDSASAEEFLDNYNSKYLELSLKDSEADWISNIQIIPGDTTNSYNLQVAREEFARFTGNSQVIEMTQELLKERNELTDLQIRQLERVLFLAGDKPGTVPQLVSDRIKMESQQNEKLYGFDFQINGESVSTNQLDERLATGLDLSQKLETWSASKEVGVVLKPGVAKLRDLRNETVQALGYNDYFDYQVSEYGMEVGEMVEMCEGFVTDIWPLYRELHTFARYELAERYGVEEVPEMIPAHWLPNRWGQDWSSLVEVEGIDLDQRLAEKEAEWLVRQAEGFYVSLGFEPLPHSFYEKSSLYPLPPDVDYKKNNHASAWHMDYNKDVRCLMSVVPTGSWYETTHHELGHIYYYISYTNPSVPPILRRGANRAFHEAVGSMLGLAAMQKPFLAHINLIEPDVEVDQIQTLLKEALNYIAFIPWSAGVMTMFEHQLYSKSLPQDEFNRTWWDLRTRYQGIQPPGPRSEDYCDAASKTHITDDAAQYYDYALSYILLFQIHQHIAEKVLNQDPHETNYYGSKETGAFLKEILEPGLTRDWRGLILEATGEPISARAMLDYFEPLTEYLQQVNQGRQHTLPPR